MLNYILDNARLEDIEILKDFKLHSIFDYAINLSKDEITDINNYVNSNIIKQIDDYKLIKINTNIIGCLYTKKYDDGILIDEIYLIKDYRNKGIGTDIIKNILHKNNSVYLWVYKNNYSAITLYKKLKFRVLQETETRYYMGKI